VRKTLLATVVALVIGFPEGSCFADGLAVNGYTASAAESQAIPANGVQASPSADHASFTAPKVAQTAGRKCYYVLDVLLCD